MIPYPPEFDYKLRPSYWSLEDPTSAIIQNVKGVMRRGMILRMLEEGVEIDPLILEDHLPYEERAPVERRDPRWMGGEYLPDYYRGEAEIARIVMASTTLDVVSIRARRRADGLISYRVVDENRGRFRFRPRRSPAPLTIQEMSDLIDGITDVGSEDLQPEGLLRGLWNQGLLDQEPEEAAAFAWVESVVYPDLGLWYQWRAERWAHWVRTRRERAGPAAC